MISLACNVRSDKTHGYFTTHFSDLSVCLKGHFASLSRERWLFDQEALQEYLLICCQDPRGGLVDKPGKARDFYHTCYTLSGLSVAQNFRWAGEGNRRILGPEDTNGMVVVYKIRHLSKFNCETDLNK